MYRMDRINQALPMISAVVGTASMAFLLVWLLLRYFCPAMHKEALCEQKPLQGWQKVSWKEAFVCSTCFLLVSRIWILMITTLYAFLAQQGDFYIHNLYGYWVKWDAPHYVGLIQNWYINEGDPRFHIVFFPMYPLVCRVFLPLFMGKAEVVALAVSNTCAWLAGAFLYRLTEMSDGKTVARRAVRFLMLNPLSFFLSIPYTEAMFLFLTIAAVYSARQRRFWIAVSVGALCALCRLMGIVVAIPIFYEMLCHERENNTWTGKRIAYRFLQCLVVLLGVGAYIALNWEVTGNPFQFVVYQREHWYNSMGTLWNTFGYLVQYLLSDASAMRYATWLATLVLVYTAILLHYLRAKKDNAGDLAYGWAYLYMTIVPTWLISGPRYVSGLYTLSPMLSRLARKRWVDAFITIAFLAGLAYMSCMFVFTGGVY